MKLNVRVHPGARAETFRRCGLAFTREWLAIDVDEATAARLAAEQMLEVEAIPVPAPDIEGNAPSPPPPAKRQKSTPSGGTK